MSKKSKRVIKDERFDNLLFPKETIEKMNELNNETHRTGREHGFALCISPQKKVVPGKEAVGNSNSIYLPESCKSRKDKYIGSYHTHPDDSETLMSAMDLHSSCGKEEKISCIGKNEYGEVQCFAKKNQKKSCQDTAETLVRIEDTYLDLSEEDYNIIKPSVNDQVDRIVDDKFNSKKILKERMDV